MPYDKTSDMNSALKNIRPKLTAAQGSLIASWADAMTKEGKVKSPWGVAISKFKRDYTVRGGKWTKRTDLKKENAIMTVKQPEIIEPVVPVEPEAKEDYAEPVAIVPYNALSFKQLDDFKSAADVSAEAKELTQEFISLVQNNMWSTDVTDKPAALKSVFDEFIARLEALDLASGEQPAEAMKESLAEASETEIMEFTEEQVSEADSTLLHMNIIPIKPGWGNTRDNHYYPKAMLESCAGKFIGAKMYETDHVQAEKSTRTWVSTITDVKGFTEDGAPIVRVAVHDPIFAEKLRNLNTEGILHKMECSILANGSVKPGYSEGERSGKVVEEITDVASVDWVTRAGAGGQALELVENDGGNTMDEKPKEGDVVETPPVENGEPEVTAEVINEQEPKPEPLTVEAIVAELEKSNLPATTQLKLVQGSYKDVAEVQAACESARIELEKLYGSGRVTDLGKVASPQIADIEKGVSEAKDQLADQYLGRK